MIDFEKEDRMSKIELWALTFCVCCILALVVVYVCVNQSWYN